MTFEVSAQPLTNENVLVAKSRDAIRINHHRGLQLRSSAECWRQAIRRMMNKITVRMAEPSDSRAIADLMGQLGYPTAPSEMQAKVDLFLALPSERVLLAERDGEVVGVLSFHLTPMLHAPGKLGRITSLVVSETYRGQGIGSRLVQEAEAWAWSKGCTKIEVTSGDRRLDAHRFYERRGYQCNERRFLKVKS
jgi:GNAT superfamily N-acetyltransferase